VGNHVQVKPILYLVGHNLIKQFVGFRFRHFLIQPSQSFAYPKDVSVNGEDGLAETEKQNARCRLRSDTWQIFEPRERFIGGHSLKELKGQVAFVGFGNSLQYRFDSRRLLV
jgi:hypothetical protein